MPCLGSVYNGKLNDESALKALKILAYFIPESSKLCMKKLLSHLNDVVALSKSNKMGVENIALIFASLIFPIVEVTKSYFFNLLVLFFIAMRFNGYYKI